MKPGTNGRRPRGRPNRKQHGGGPQRQNAYDGGGSDGRARGNAHQVYERYLAMARDALSAGDRIAAEAYYQHAEHYFRVLNSSTDPQPNGQVRPNRPGGDGRTDGGRTDWGRTDDGRTDDGRRDDDQRDRQRDGAEGGQPPSVAAPSPTAQPVTQNPAPVIPVTQGQAAPEATAVAPDGTPHEQGHQARPPRPEPHSGRRRGPAQPRVAETLSPSEQPIAADNPVAQPGRRPRGCEPVTK